MSTTLCCDPHIVTNFGRCQRPLICFPMAGFFFFFFVLLVFFFSFSFFRPAEIFFKHAMFFVNSSISVSRERQRAPEVPPRYGPARCVSSCIANVCRSCSTPPSSEWRQLVSTRCWLIPSKSKLHEPRHTLDTCLSERLSFKVVHN